MARADLPGDPFCPPDACGRRAGLQYGTDLVGLLAHPWWFGYIKMDEQRTSKPQLTEARAAQMR
jgi:hypothetical protein